MIAVRPKEGVCVLHFLFSFFILARLIVFICYFLGREKYAYRVSQVTTLSIFFSDFFLLTFL